MKLGAKRWCRVVAMTLAMVPALSGCGNDEPKTEGGPAIVRLLTETQYRQIIADLFGSDIAVAGRFNPLNRTNGLLTLGASKAAITPAAYEQYDSMAHAIADQVVDPTHRDFLVPCKPASATASDSPCAGQFLRATGRRPYRRPLHAGELQAVTTLADQAAASLGDFYAGLAYGLSALLESPDFLLVRDTVADDSGDEPRQLDAWSKASRLSFLLWNTAPDDALLAAAEKGDLNNNRGLAHQVDRMLASPRLADGIRAFFSDMLGFDGFESLAKDQVIYPAFTQPVAADARDETLRTITDLIVTQKADYRDLFTTHETFLNRRLGALYRLPVTTTDGWQRYDLPADSPRSGIVTELSFLALHSHPGRSSATLRGKAVRELLLCQKVPDPPANVNFAIVQDTTNATFRTARARLTAHRTEPTCAGCHKIMDPIGLALENFDGAGQFRARENGEAIDASGTLDSLAFKDARELGLALHDNPAATSCLVHRLYSYGVGRPVAKSEAAWIADLGRDFADDHYRVTALLRRIATSQAFYAIAKPKADSSASSGSMPKTPGG